MRLRLTAAIALACALVALPVAADGATGPGNHNLRGGAPAGFFGIVPQTSLTPEDALYMKAGGIESVRISIGWSEVQPTPTGPYNWTNVDNAVAIATSAGLQVLPFLASTPRWVAHKSTTLPIDSARARRAWKAFVRAAVERYGPGGEFWAEHSREGIDYESAIPNPLPIRIWQIWNEANFFYSAYPASPTRYARLLKISHAAIKAADPRAKVMIAGLFGKPDERGRLAMPAAQFLQEMYDVPGIKSDFDAIAIHPYAFHVEDLEALTRGIHAVALRNHDRRTALYITEMGWGSQNDPSKVAFEQGLYGQARELRLAYRFLLENRRQLNLRGAYWFTWKDLNGYCNFCDSVGLFHAGSRFHSKPAWHVFVHLTGGRVRP